jgi:hypothetical protein
MCPSCWNRTQVTTAYYDFLLEANPKAAAALKEHVATFEGIPAAPMNPGMNRFQQELEFYTVKKECDCGGSIERGRTVTCDHSLPRKDAVAHCPSKSLRHMCFTCEARFCDKCFTNYHENPEFEMCLHIPYSHFQWMHRVYLLVTKRDDGEDVRCSALAEAGSRTNSELGRSIQRLMIKEMTQFGRSHTISLADLALLYAYDLRRIRLSTDIESEGIISNFHRMGCCARCLYDTELCCRFNRQNSRFPICRNTIASVESIHGHSMANYFRTFRWFIFLNVLLSLIFFLFIILPGIYNGAESIEPRALLLGYGAETSIFFYGGFLPVYPSGWHMDTAWILILGAALFFSLFFIVCSFDPDSIAQAEERSITSEHPFTAVLGGISFNERDPRRITQEIQALATRLDVLGMTHLWVAQTRVNDRARPCCTGPCDPWYVWFIISMGWIGGACTLIWYAASWLDPEIGRIAKFEDRSPELWDYAWLLFPLGVAVLKFLMPPFLRCCVTREYSPYYYKPDDIRSAYFWRLFLQRMAFAAIVMYILVTYRSEQFVPSVTSAMAAAGGAVGCACPPGEVCTGPADFQCPCKQTEIGIRFYRFIIVDIAWSFILTVLWSPVKFCLRSCVIGCGCGSCIEGSQKATFNREVDYALKNSILQRMREQRTRSEFDPLENLLDLVYRQAFIWAGMIYSPMVPVVAFMCSLVLFFVKTMEVMICGRRSWMSQLPAATQEVYLLFALLAAAVLAFFPMSSFISSTSSCGPFFWSSAEDMSLWEAWFQITQGLPEWARVIFDYFTNTMILWMVILIGLIYILTMSRQVSMMLERHDFLRVQIRLEARERMRKMREVEFLEVGRVKPM